MVEQPVTDLDESTDAHQTSDGGADATAAVVILLTAVVAVCFWLVGQ